MPDEPVEIPPVPDTEPEEPEEEIPTEIPPVPEEEEAVEVPPVPQESEVPSEDLDSISLLVKAVDGNFIRDNLNADFTMGGHGLAWDFIPEGEIWIDSSNISEAKETLAHELAEWTAMRLFDLDYDTAHEIAAGYEQALRSAAGGEKVSAFQSGLIDELRKIISR